MDIQQALDLTYVKVEEVQKKLENISNNLEDTDSILNGTTVNEIKTKVTEIKNSCSNILTQEKLDTATDKIIGTDDIDLTKINEKLENLTGYLGENPVPLPFEEDPYKLEEDFTGYTKGETIFNTTDYVECTKPYIINNILEKNYELYVSSFAVYCEGDSFDMNFTIDVTTTNSSSIIEITLPDTTIGSSNINKKTYSLVEGRNIITDTITGINVNSNGNYVKMRFTNDKATVNNFKIEVIGQNIFILTKPAKYKVFSKHNETIISKVENNNGYCLILNSSNMNPSDLKKDYKLIQADVRDFQCIKGTYQLLSVSFNGFHCYGYLNLDGLIYQKVEDSNDFFVPNQERSETLVAIDNADSQKFFKTYHICNNGNKISLFFAGNALYTGYSINLLGASHDIAANVSVICDNYNKINTEPSRIILTKKDGTNILFFQVSSTASRLELGLGRNVTAYYDKDTRNVIYAYMKVGDKMVKKTIAFTESTDEDGNVVESASITSQKIIGTYDYYFETDSNKYFVVKDNKLYMFKNN